MMRQTLLHILNYSPRGQRAIDHFLIEFARQARQRDWDVHYAFASPPSDSFAQELAQFHTHWHVVEFPLTWKSLARLAKDLADFKPHITQTSFISVFTPALLRWKLGRYTRHVLVLDHSSGNVSSRNRWVTGLRQFRGWLFGKVIDAIVPVSEFVASRDRQDVYFPANQIHVIPNGIDLARYPYRQREPSSVLRVAYVGQLIPEKGVDLLIAAVKHIHETDPVPVEIHIAGAGPQEVKLKEQAAGMQNIRFLGFVERAADVFDWADVVVIPSRWAEAFGLVAIEAMATGAVVIASNAGGLPEVVGDAGLVFPEGDSFALAEQLAKIFKDPQGRKRLGELARKRVETFYSLTEVVTRQCQLCEEFFPPNIH